MEKLFMHKELKKITAVFIIAIFLFLITGCLNPGLNNINSGTEAAKSNKPSDTEGKQESSVAGNPGDSGSTDTLDDTVNTSGSSEKTITTNNDGSSSGAQDKEAGSTSTTVNDSNSSQKSVNTLPVLSLEVIEGPVVLEDNSLCYYRIKANVKGSPRPKIYFSKDDSSGAWGENIVQVNLFPDEAYELTVKASNSSGQANASVILNWKESNIKTGQTNIISDEANPANYFIEVSLSEQKVRVFYKNSLLKEMVCSSGAPLTPTPKGTFKTSDKIKYAWLAQYNVGAYYFVRFYGPYLFHSTPFDKEGNLIEIEQQNLGKPVSHGCVRIDLNEEKWLYETVPSGVTVKIN
jgi:lipoprotein-anchoring transpeptidase ErfK/SrfK